MRAALTLVAMCSLGISFTPAAASDGKTAAVSDEATNSANFAAASSRPVVLRTDCPREFRGIYRGVLYCRQPEYQLLAVRRAECPENVTGFYRGDLFCFGRR